MIDSDEGVDFLIARLTVVLIVSLIVLSATASFAGSFILRVSSSQARAGVIDIAEKSRAVYAADCPDYGERTQTTLTIPPVIRVVGFGTATENDGNRNLSRAYFIRYLDGGIESFVSEVPFAKANESCVTDEPLFLYPGNYLLSIRAVTINGTVKAAISAEES